MSVTDMTSEFAAAARPHGVTPPSGSGGRVLSEVILDLGFTDRATVDHALAVARAPGKKLGTILLEMGALSERELGRAVAEGYGLPFLELSEFDVDPEAVHVIGDAELRRYDAVPVAFTEDGALVVAMIDPADWLAAEEMAKLTGRRIRRAVATPSEVSELIGRVAEARAAGDGADSHGRAADESSTMPSRLMLRPVRNPLPGRVPPDGEPPAAEAAEVQRRVIPLTPRAVRAEPLGREEHVVPAGREAVEQRVADAGPDELEEIRAELCEALAAIDHTRAALASLRDRLEALKSA